MAALWGTRRPQTAALLIDRVKPSPSLPARKQVERVPLLDTALWIGIANRRAAFWAAAREDNCWPDCGIKKRLDLRTVALPDVYVKCVPLSTPLLDFPQPPHTLDKQRASAAQLAVRGQLHPAAHGCEYGLMMGRMQVP